MLLCMPIYYVYIFFLLDIVLRLQNKCIYIVKRVKAAHEWAHMPCQILTAPNSTPEQLTDSDLYLDIAKSGNLFHGYSSSMVR